MRMVLLLGLVATTARADPALLLYGGKDNKIFLGCLNCGKFDPNSVHNEFSEYGSTFSSTSIRNKFSDYGSAFSDYSACNVYASHPPVIVDKDGKYYGKLTINRFADQTRYRAAVDWISAVCASS